MSRKRTEQKEVIIVLDDDETSFSFGSSNLINSTMSQIDEEDEEEKINDKDHRKNTKNNISDDNSNYLSVNEDSNFSSKSCIRIDSSDGGDDNDDDDDYFVNCKTNKKYTKSKQIEDDNQAILNELNSFNVGSSSVKSGNSKAKKIKALDSSSSSSATESQQSSSNGEYKDVNSNSSAKRKRAEDSDCEIIEISDEEAVVKTKSPAKNPSFNIEHSSKSEIENKLPIATSTSKNNILFEVKIADSSLPTEKVPLELAADSITTLDTQSKPVIKPNKSYFISNDDESNDSSKSSRNGKTEKGQGLEKYRNQVLLEKKMNQTEKSNSSANELNVSSTSIKSMEDEMIEKFNKKQKSPDSKLDRSFVLVKKMSDAMIQQLKQKSPELNNVTVTATNKNDSESSTNKQPSGNSNKAATSVRPRIPAGCKPIKMNQDIPKEFLAKNSSKEKSDRKKDTNTNLASSTSNENLTNKGSKEAAIQSTDNEKKKSNKNLKKSDPKTSTVSVNSKNNDPPSSLQSIDSAAPVNSSNTIFKPTLSSLIKIQSKKSSTKVKDILKNNNSTNSSSSSLKTKNQTKTTDSIKSSSNKEDAIQIAADTNANASSAKQTSAPSSSSSNNNNNQVSSKEQNNQNKKPAATTTAAEPSNPLLTFRIPKKVSPATTIAELYKTSANKENTVVAEKTAKTNSKLTPNVDLKTKSVPNSAPVTRLKSTNRTEANGNLEPRLVKESNTVLMPMNQINNEIERNDETSTISTPATTTTTTTSTSTSTTTTTTTTSNHVAQNNKLVKVQKAPIPQTSILEQPFLNNLIPNRNQTNQASKSHERYDFKNPITLSVLIEREKKYTDSLGYSMPNLVSLNTYLIHEFGKRNFASNNNNSYTSFNYMMANLAPRAPGDPLSIHDLSNEAKLALFNLMAPSVEKKVNPLLLAGFGLDYVSVPAKKTPATTTEINPFAFAFNDKNLSRMADFFVQHIGLLTIAEAYALFKSYQLAKLRPFRKIELYWLENINNISMRVHFENDEKCSTDLDASNEAVVSHVLHSYKDPSDHHQTIFGFLHSNTIMKSPSESCISMNSQEIQFDNKLDEAKKQFNDDELWDTVFTRKKTELCKEREKKMQVNLQEMAKTCQTLTFFHMKQQEYADFALPPESEKPRFLNLRKQTNNNVEERGNMRSTINNKQLSEKDYQERLKVLYDNPEFDIDLTKLFE